MSSGRTVVRAPCAQPSPARGQLTSSHGGDGELRAFLDARGPTGGHRLGLGVEAYSIRSVLIEIAEARTLPAAEGVIGQWHRDRHIDADHADLNFRGEV